VAAEIVGLLDAHLPSQAMMQWIHARLQDPVFLLVLAAGLIAFAVQSGDLDSVDTTRRLQTTHSFWTSAPAVIEGDYPDFGLRGRNGKIYAWYGMGQSLLMLPADVAGTYIENLRVFRNYYGTDPAVRSMIVAYSTNILINVLTALVCFRLLTLFNFSTKEAVYGTLALLVCTTHLHYTQNMMENNYILLLTLAGFAYQYEWLITGSQRALAIGSAAFGLNLLTRLTTGMDLVLGGVFLLLVLRMEGKSVGDAWRRFREYAAVALPIYAVFLVIDRCYQYYRFGSFFNTYVTVVAQQAREMNPSLPANYPFETPFHVGFFGALFAPEKSIFLFDPLLILIVVLVVVGWKRFNAAVKAFLISTSLLLLIYICFYARYTVWSGDSAWGDRYVSTAAQLLAFISVPLLMHYRRELGGVIWRLGLAIVACAVAIQVASVMFWLSLELYQVTTLGHPTFVVWLRFKNIVAFALDKREAWGLTNDDMLTDPWDYVHITTWNFLPFMLRRVGEAPTWVVRVAFGVWTVSLAAVAWTLWWVRAVLARGSAEPAKS
jgi:hypothetical protein